MIDILTFVLSQTPNKSLDLDPILALVCIVGAILIPVSWIFFPFIGEKKR